MEENKTEPAKYVPKNLQNQQDFAPKKIGNNANHNQNLNNQQNQQLEQPSRPIQYNAFNFGTKKQVQNKKQQRHNFQRNYQDEEQFQPIRDYRPKPPKPESTPNPQPREFNKDYVPKLQPTDMLSKDKNSRFTINPALIVQKK